MMSASKIIQIKKLKTYSFVSLSFLMDNNAIVSIAQQLQVGSRYTNSELNKIY